MSVTPWYSAGQMYRTVERDDLRIEREQWDTACRDCGDDQVEMRIEQLPDGQETTYACLTCGLVRRHHKHEGIVTEPVVDDGTKANRTRDDEIRAMGAAGVPMTEISQRFGLSSSRVGQVLAGVRRINRHGHGGHARYSDDDVLDAICAYHDRTGEWPSYRTWQRAHLRPSGSAVLRRFGDWPSAVAEAKKRR